MLFDADEVRCASLRALTSREGEVGLDEASGE